MLRTVEHKGLTPTSQVKSSAEKLTLTEKLKKANAQSGGSTTKPNAIQSAPAKTEEAVAELEISGKFSDGVTKQANIRDVVLITEEPAAASDIEEGSWLLRMQLDSEHHPHMKFVYRRKRKKALQKNP